MSALTQAIDSTNKRIDDATRLAGRAPGAVQLIAVSKTYPAETLRAAYDHGLRHFGESYVQEALEKIEALQDCAIVWHFIGPLQSNKTRAIAERFDWVHSVDRLKIARRLSEQRPAALAPLNVCLQVNISHEASKAGVAEAELPALAAAVAELPRLRLRGLMAIPAATPDPDEQLRVFTAVAEAWKRLVAGGLALDTLSMGMSADLEMAIRAGATHVRVGSAIFGARKPGLRTEV